MAFNIGINQAPRRKDPPKQAGRLVSLFGNTNGNSRPNSESTSNKGSRDPRNFKQFPQDLTQKGTGLRGRSDPPKLDIKRLTASAENDERFKYLLKNGTVKRVEDNDRLIYAELPQIPGVLVVYRKPSDRNANPERLNLDKRELEHVPLLEGEERLRLLNFQHNMITKIENLVSLPNLIFLDLYNNKVREISHLHTVPTLRVLMLGKNQIERIRNLQCLSRLDVLDFHSNKISTIEGICHLKELRVLNLANNSITTVENLVGLVSLTEINLRKNQIQSLAEIDKLPKLQRAFLSNNKFSSCESIDCLTGCGALQELALDGNPVSTHPEYRTWILNAVPSLKNLDTKKITAEMRKPLAEINHPPAVNESVPPVESSENIAASTSAATTKEEPEDESGAQIITHIESEWRQEIVRITSTSAQARKKESLSDCLVKSAHAILEADTDLLAYGNALEVLDKVNEYPNV